MRLSAFFIAAIASLTTFTHTAFSDVVKIGPDGRGDILYRAGAFVEHGECPDGATIRRRTTCTQRPERIEAVSLYDYVLDQISHDLPAIDQAMGEAQANLAETDVKLQEYLSTDPQTPGNEQDLEDIQKAESAAAEMDTEVQGLKEQIARIKASPDYRTNPDLPRQLATLESQLTNSTKARDAKVAELNALRAHYVSAHSAGHSQAGFQVLVHQRATQASQYDSLSARSHVILEQLVTMHQFIGELLEDQSFAYEISDDAPFARELRTVFGDFHVAQKESGVIQSEMTESGIEFVIPHKSGMDRSGRFTDYASVIKWMRCSFRPFGDGLTRCTGLSVMNLSEDSDSGRSRVWTLPLAFDVLANQSHDEFDEFRHDAMRFDESGNWVFTPICNRTVIDRRNLGQGSCEVGFTYEALEP